MTNTIVDEVARVLDDRKRKDYLAPAKSTGEYDTWTREKEKDRKDLKLKHPNTPLKFNASTKKWEVNRPVKEELQNLEEISIRTIGLGATMLKHRGHRQKTLQHATKMRSLGGQLISKSEDDERFKLLGTALQIFADYMIADAGMSASNNQTTAVGTVGVDRAYKMLKKMTKVKRR